MGVTFQGGPSDGLPLQSDGAAIKSNGSTGTNDVKGSDQSSRITVYSGPKAGDVLNGPVKEILPNGVGEEALGAEVGGLSKFANEDRDWQNCGIDSTNQNGSLGPAWLGDCVGAQKGIDMESTDSNSSRTTS